EQIQIDQVPLALHSARENVAVLPYELVLLLRPRALLHRWQAVILYVLNGIELLAHHAANVSFNSSITPSISAPKSWCMRAKPPCWPRVPSSGSSRSRCTLSAMKSRSRRSQSICSTENFTLPACLRKTHSWKFFRTVSA